MTGGRPLAALALLGLAGLLAPAAAATPSASPTATPAASSTGAPAAVPSGSIALATRDDGQLRVVFQAEGLPRGTTIDPASVTVTIGGTSIGTLDVQPVDDGEPLDQTTVLAIDTSKSMGRLDKLASAQNAAKEFVDLLPADVMVGLVTFADVVEAPLAPTGDHAAVKAAIDALQVSTVTGTALFDGAARAVDQTGAGGVRSVLLLSDGNDFGTSATTPDAVVGTATEAGVLIDAVYIGSSAVAPDPLAVMVDGTRGTVAKAGTADLSAVFRQVAQDIATRISISATLPDGLPDSAQVVVTALAGDVRLDDSVTSFASGEPAQPRIVGPRRVPVPSSLFPAAALPFLLGAMFLGLLVIVYVALGTVRRDEKQGRLRRRLSLYTLSGRTPAKQQQDTTVLGSSQVARSAVELAGKVVEKRDFEGALSLRLDAAGVPLRAAEWMIIHIGVAISTAFLLLLVSGGALLPTLLGLALGLGLPWAYLRTKETRRTSSFLAQLPDTLQMVAGSLSAGYSVPQAMDTVVREGQQPITGEFNRALIEARLGVPMDDALDGIAERMHSKDFAWVVMAIRIQRDVGGNLAELLTTVAATLRERETLRRQVRVLSAEGRLSAWILGLLPPVFALYLVLAQPDYLRPLVTQAMGWLLLGVGGVLLAVGALWMRKAVRVEV